MTRIDEHDDWEEKNKLRKQKRVNGDEVWGKFIVVSNKHSSLKTSSDEHCGGENITLRERKHINDTLEKEKKRFCLTTIHVQNLQHLA